MSKTKKMLILATIAFVILLLIIISTSDRITTFRGKLIDADTKKSIEGAVVVASWDEERVVVAEGGTRLKDVRESLTDKNGEWTIKGPRGRIRGNFISLVSFFTGIYITQPPRFIIFKPGYCSWPQGFYVESCKRNLIFELDSMGHYKVGDGETIGLPILRNRQDRTKNLPGPTDGREKQKEFIKLINEECRYLNLEKF